MEEHIKIIERVKNKDDNNVRMIPAIPPEDYTGSQGDWQIALIERDLWNGEGWHGDIEISSDAWWGILKECEGYQDL